MHIAGRVYRTWHVCRVCASASCLFALSKQATGLDLMGEDSAATLGVSVWQGASIRHGPVQGLESRFKPECHAPSASCASYSREVLLGVASAFAGVLKPPVSLQQSHIDAESGSALPGGGLMKRSPLQTSHLPLPATKSRRRAPSPAPPQSLFQSRSDSEEAGPCWALCRGRGAPAASGAPALQDGHRPDTKDQRHPKTAAEHCKWLRLSLLDMKPGTHRRREEKHVHGALSLPNNS